MISGLERVRADVVATGRIGERELDIICRQLYPEGKLGREEVEFLASIRGDAQSVIPAFEELFAEAVKLNVLEGGRISSDGASWLRRLFLLSARIDVNTRRLLGELQREAKHVCPEFQSLYDECT